MVLSHACFNLTNSRFKTASMIHDFSPCMHVQMFSLIFLKNYNHEGNLRFLYTFFTTQCFLFEHILIQIFFRETETNVDYYIVVNQVSAGWLGNFILRDV